MASTSAFTQRPSEIQETRPSYIADFDPPPVSNSELLLPVVIAEQNLVEISAAMFVVFYRGSEIHMTRRRASIEKHKVIHKTGST